MRPSLLPLEITAEPEGHMAADKRADISVAMPSRKILCELKRDYNDEVWTAVEGQLERFYAHDPDAKGFGIYCIFWFSGKRPYNIPPHPKGLTAPQNSAEMELMLKKHRRGSPNSLARLGRMFRLPHRTYRLDYVDLKPAP
jgi:hypothetical protein